MYHVWLTILVLLFISTILQIQPQAFGETVKKGIVLLVQFPDVPNNVDRNQAQMRFSRQLNNYVQEMSYQSVIIKNSYAG